MKQGRPELPKKSEIETRIIVLDRLLTRWHAAELNLLLDRYQRGELDQSYVLGFVSALNGARTLPEHLGAGRTLYDYVTKEMHHLVSLKFGPERGSLVYRQLFGFMSDSQALLADGKLKVATLMAWLSSLETALSYVELTAFITAKATIREYLHRSLCRISDQLAEYQTAIDTEADQLPDQRRVDLAVIKKLKWQLVAYSDALSRLGFFEKTAAAGEDPFNFGG